MTLKKSPRAVAVESTPQLPVLITVPGDASTPAGHRYDDTYGNDFRQDIEWSEDHERQVLQLLATAQQHQLPVHNGMSITYRTFNVPVEAIAVFLQSVPKADAVADDVKKYFSDSDGYFNIVTDDGRQRRRGAVEVNRRLNWIADTFVRKLWADTSDATERRVALRNRLLSYDSKAATADQKAPPQPRDATDTSVAAWLTEAFVDKLIGPVAWFADNGDPIPLALRVDVRGENVDLANDHTVLLNNIRGAAASVPTPLHVDAKRYKKMLAALDTDGEPRYTLTTLAKELKCSNDKIMNAIYYTEIAAEIREAIDHGRVALKLCVTGRDCICYGFVATVAHGGRQLLTTEQQLAIWGELLRAFSVEAIGEDGIPDNAATRAILRKIKSEILAGTPWADSNKAASPRKSLEASKAAAARAGIGAAAPTVDTSALDAMKAPLSKIAGGDDTDDDRDADDTAPSKKSLTSKPAAASTPPLAGRTAPVTIRAALATKAKLMMTTLSDFVATDRDADEDGLVLAVADAVAAVYEGGDPKVLFARFPVLLEALGTSVGTVKKPRSSSTPTPRGPVSPLQRQQQLKDTVARAIEMVEEIGGAVTEGAISKMLNAAADEVCSGSAAAEFLIDAAALLKVNASDFATAPRQDDLANHIREGLYS